ncbi:hypothetical protein [Bacillus sp. SM2101]|uniref:hypothetical protein n=1 Tax=Bacillus sp. SM2101 TaxID=2805366 RepID=UPI001BDECB57|nr:hypothetical protein [Bacillus sp. SM2101]
MDKILVLYMIIPIMLIILFQPQLNNVEQARDIVSKQAIERATEKAAIEGYYTPEIIEEMTELLMKLGYSEDEIEYRLTTDVTYRGDIIEGTVKLPDKYSFILISNLIERKENDELYHVNTASRMSEFVN